MIKLNLNENKRLKFSYGVSNVLPDEIKGKFILDFGDVNIGYPIKIQDSKIQVDVKHLDRFLTEGMGLVDAKLEIIANDTFIVPWEGQVRINGPVKMTVKEDIPETKPVKRKEPKVEKKRDTREIASKYIDDKPDQPAYEGNDHLERLIAFRENFIIEEVRDKDIIEKEKVFSDFLSTPIEELI